IQDAGYSVTPQTWNFATSGMTCASCVARVERALGAVPGVEHANVNLATESVQVTAAGVSPQTLIAAIGAAGYEARLVDSSAADTEAEATRRDAEQQGLKRSLIIALILTLPIFVIEMGSHFIPAVHNWVSATIGMQNSWYVQFALTTLVLVGP